VKLFNSCEKSGMKHFSRRTVLEMVR